MTYRAKEITQHDGSSLENANCRMAAGATGIDYHTGGRVTSTGAAMRSRQGDQSGGTDSGDLKQAWASYGESLSVRDGRTFDDAVADLRAGRLVHLDIWAASTGGPCLSDSGAYGHTVVVAPEKSGDKWLVGDPWCGPNTWTWWLELKLRAGAEEWGGRVYSATRGPHETIADVIRRLMTQWRPDQPATGRDAETGGNAGGPILYTATAERDTAMADIPILDPTPKLVDLAKGTAILNPDGSARSTLSSTRNGVLSPFASRTVGGTNSRCIIYTRADPDPDILLAVYTSAANNIRPVPADCPECPPADDGDRDAIRAERDAEWVDHLTPPA